MKYIRIGSRNIYVSEEVYEVYRQTHRQERYMKERSIAHRDVSLESLKREVASDVSIEDTYERNIKMQKLWNALHALSNEEFDFINLHFFEGYSLQEMSEITGMSYIKCWRFRKRVLEKLREMIGTID